MASVRLSSHIYKIAIMGFAKGHFDFAIFFAIILGFPTAAVFHAIICQFSVSVD